MTAPGAEDVENIVPEDAESVVPDLSASVAERTMVGDAERAIVEEIAVDAEITVLGEITVEDLHCNSLSVGLSPSVSGTGCRWDCGSPLGPSTFPPGVTSA